MLVPRVLGQTAEARQQKTAGRPRASRRWDEESLIGKVERQAGPDAADVARRIIDWSRGTFSRLEWGRGSKFGGFSPALDHTGRSYWPFYLWTTGKIRIEFQWMKGMPPFDRVERRVEFMERLNAIPGVELASSSIDGKPAIPLTVLSDDASLEALFETLKWFLAEATSTQA
jgi:hypothetical protein